MPPRVSAAVNLADASQLGACAARGEWDAAQVNEALDRMESSDAVNDEDGGRRDALSGLLCGALAALAAADHGHRPVLRATSSSEHAEAEDASSEDSEATEDRCFDSRAGPGRGRNRPHNWLVVRVCSGYETFLEGA